MEVILMLHWTKTGKDNILKFILLHTSATAQHPRKYATWTNRGTEIHSDLQNPALLLKFELELLENPRR